MVDDVDNEVKKIYNKKVERKRERKKEAKKVTHKRMKKDKIYRKRTICVWKSQYKM